MSELVNVNYGTKAVRLLKRFWNCCKTLVENLQLLNFLDMAVKPREYLVISSNNVYSWGRCRQWWPKCRPRCRPSRELMVLRQCSCVVCTFCLWL